MLELVNAYQGYEDETELITHAVVKPFNCNRIWGYDYLLMDSKNFMGGTGENYDSIIDMYNNIWNAYEYKVLGNLYL